MTHETRIKDAVNMEDLIWPLATVRTLKGTQMAPLLALVSPCFRGNVIVMCMQNCVCLCSLDNFLLKMFFFSFVEIKFQDGAHLKKKDYF